MEPPHGAVARQLPQGVVTFLFTDVEGSTSLLEEHADAAGAVLARHHELLAEVIGEHGGTVFETVGDAVYGAFATPSDAILAAVEVHRRLAVEPWPGIGELRVRVAIHSGAVESRGGHYFGAALFECSRMQALAHGGQTLTSATSAALAARGLPAGVTLRPLGPYRLKDMAAPMEVVQVDAQGLPTAFPPLRSAVATTNLPHEATAFIGRDAELEAIADLLAHHRLVSLLGPGGMGKTRLALQAAAAELERFPDGVWLVELAPIGTPELVLNQLADVWGLRPGHTTSLEDVVRRYLEERQLLLVVDNCEHVREGAATMVSDLLRTAPGITVLATSRESLGVPGETEYRVGPLSLPEDGEVDASDAVRLYLDRVRAVRPDLEVTTEDLGAIAHVCRRLEGMPLGLELAAARVRSLSPAELAERLDRSFESLGASKSAVPRQRTLSATLDWSHDLLGDAERTVLRRVSVFAGGFDPAAAEQVAGADGLEADVLDALQSLVDKSLVLASVGPTTRYRLLEPVRQYAAARLDEAGETSAMREAHAAHYADFVATASPHTRGPEQMAWDRRIDTEYPNIRLALDYLLAAGELDRYLRLGFDLFIYWMHVGMHVEGIATLVAGLERVPSSEPVRERELQGRFVVAILLAELTDPAGVAHARHGLERARAEGDANAIGRMELGLGAAIRHSTHDPEYLEHLLEARRLLDAHAEPHWWEPAWEHALHELMLGAYLPPDEGRSRAHLEEAMAGFRSVGDEALYAAALAETPTHWGQGDDEVLMANLVRAIELMGSMRLPYWYGHALLSRGTLLQLEGQAAESIPWLAEAADELEVIGDLFCWSSACRRLATARVQTGDAQAARLPLAKVIESLPQVALSEAGVPRTLDAAVEVLLGLGLEREAAVVLGRSRATDFPVETILPRDTVLDGLQASLAERLDATVLRELMAEGAAADPYEVLARAAGWLRGA